MSHDNSAGCHLIVFGLSNMIYELAGYTGATSLEVTRW